MKTYPLLVSSVVDNGLLNNLVSCWEMTDGSGTTITDEEGNYDMSLVGGSWGTTPPSVLLDGTNDYLTAGDISNGLNFATKHSISVWVRRNGDNNVSSSVGCIMSRYYSSTGLRIYYFDIIDSTHATLANNLRFGYYDTSNVLGTVIYDPGSNIWHETWKHVVSTRNGSTLKLYVDGVLVRTATSQGNGSGKMNTSTSTDNLIGAFSKSSTIPDAFIKANIGQSAVWEEELTLEQVQALYNDGNGLEYKDWN